MTRTEAIDVINRSLAAIDDARVQMLADIARSMAEPIKPLSLTPDELAALERSKADFAAGRTHTLEEMDAFLDAAAAQRAARRTA